MPLWVIGYVLICIVLLIICIYFDHRIESLKAEMRKRFLDEAKKREETKNNKELE